MFKEKSKEMKTKNGITINITADDMPFDQLNKQAADEIQILKETDDLSNYEPIVFSNAFKKRYHKLMTFCDDGSVVLSFS